MRSKNGRVFLYRIFAIFAVSICSVANAADPLPSWNPLDNDGTLWVEYPMYTQVLFAFDRIKTLAPQHPEWKTKQPL